MPSTRRRFLRLVPLGFATTLLAACAPPSTPPAAAPTAPPPSPSPVPTLVPTAAPRPTDQPATTATVVPAAQPTAAKASAVPSYIPLANKPTADYPSRGELFEDGYINYPASPARATPAEPPGLGSTVSVFVDGL